MPSEEIQITLYLELAKTDQAAMVKLFQAVQGQFKRIAWNHLNSEEGYHTLQATCLSNDAFLKLMEDCNVVWENKEQFFGAASKVMRRILIDHYRRRAAKKRGGVEEGRRRKAPSRFALSDALSMQANDPQEVVALHEIVERLACENPNVFAVFNLHFYMGCQHKEIAEMLEISESTVKRRWSMAIAYVRKAWVGGEADNG